MACAVNAILKKKIETVFVICNKNKMYIREHFFVVCQRKIKKFA